MRRTHIRGVPEDATGLGARRSAGTVPPQRRSADDSEAGHPAGAEGPAGPDGPDGPAPVAGRSTGPTSRQRPARRRPLWRRVLVWTAGSLAVVVAAAAVAGWLYIRHLNDNLDKEELYLGEGEMAGSQPNADGQTPMNILLLGSDSRDGEANQELGGAVDLAGGAKRADTQILLHVAADRSNATLISIPRDTQVTIPTCTDPDTGEVYPEEQSASINTSLSHGGPGCTVATWHELTGIPIDHFMMVDFEGVVEMADAVGGVPVCVKDNVFDPDSGLRLPAGEHIVQGEQALQWLRTRHGFEDGSDIGRTRAQQMYLSNMVRELQAGTSLTDPGRLMDLAEAATSALTVDHGLGSVNKLYDLGEDLRQVPNERINMVTMPWLPDPENPEVTVIPEPVAAEELFAMVREDIPIDRPHEGGDAQDGAAGEAGGDEGAGGASPSPSGDEDPAVDAQPAAEIPIAVRNGTGYGDLAPVNGRAGELVAELQRLGFLSALSDATPASQESTTLLYPSDDEAQARANAEAVAQALGLPDTALQPTTAVTQLTLVVGADWREGASYPGGQPSDDATGGDDGAGAGAGGGGVPVDPDDIISGRDQDTCMEVNPNYTW